MSADEPRPQPPQLRDVLDTLDTWIHSERGLLAVSFTYRTSGGFEVAVEIKNGRGKLAIPHE